MSNHIIDIAAVTVTFETDTSNTERLVVTSDPTKVGSYARIILWAESGEDANMLIRRGAGLSGDVVWSGGWSGRSSVVVVDDSPVSQYTVSNSDDTAYSLSVTLSVEQIG